jgi:hypothetical protein
MLEVKTKLTDRDKQVIGKYITERMSVDVVSKMSLINLVYERNFTIFIGETIHLAKWQNRKNQQKFHSTLGYWRRAFYVDDGGNRILHGLSRCIDDTHNEPKYDTLAYYVDNKLSWIRTSVDGKLSTEIHYDKNKQIVKSLRQSEIGDLIKYCEYNDANQFTFIQLYSNNHLIAQQRYHPNYTHTVEWQTGITNSVSNGSSYVFVRATLTNPVYNQI